MIIVRFFLPCFDSSLGVGVASGPKIRNIFYYYIILCISERGQLF